MHAALVARYGDHARFEPDDPVELVRAALACPYCLMAAEEWTFVRSGPRPAVKCLCSDCQTDWYVFMTAEQALRLGLTDMLGRLPF